jgi:putative nucleotidyltransferase with HDIG domain
MTSPRASLTWYVRLVVAAGAAVLAHSLVALVGTPHPLQWLLFGALAILTGSFTLKVASIEATMSVADTFFISTAVLFGPAAAAMTLAVDTLILSWRKRYSADRIAFNVVAPALSLWAAANVFFALAGVPPLSVAPAPLVSLIVPLLALAAVYFLLNSGLIAIAVGLESQRSPIRIWREHFLWLSIGYFAAASVAFCLTIVTQQVGLGAVAVIVPVLIVFHLTLQASFGRLEDANQHVKQVDRLYTSTVETLAMAIDAKDDVTHNHVRRVQTYALALARALGISDERELKAIEAAALLHDTGKLAVPEHILNKPGGLTPAEFEQMKRHVDVGADILSLVDFPYPVVPIVRCHHENWDGSGYPNGVKGTDIPIGARILSVVDCYDALMSDRPYRRRLTDEEAIAIIQERRGRMYDPDVVDMFARIRRDVAFVEEAGPEVFQRISDSRQPKAALAEAPAAATATTGAIAPPDDVLAFVSLARLSSGSAELSDVLALASTLVGRIVPETTTGAWFIMNASNDRVSVAQAFGPAAPAVRDLSFAVGERLSGWVAAHQKVVVNSDPALDLGDSASQGSKPLRSCLSVPICAGPATVGVLSLYGEGREGFTADQGRLIEIIAPHLAQAITSASAAAAASTPPRAAQKPERELRLVSR